jgi:DNA-binding NarL/FixJ family response regulator
MSDRSKVRIVLADDHVVIRAGIRRILEEVPEFSVVGEASDGREAVELVERVEPDVVILDVGMPVLNGNEAAAQIHSRHPRTAIVMLSMHSDETYVLRALRSGARAYLLKNAAESDLKEAVRAVAGGRSYFSPAVSKILLEDYIRKLQRTGAEDSYELLSLREREVLQLIAEGKSTKEVAGLLNISEHTAESHRTNLMKKLGLRGLAELILYAVRKGLIS